MWDKVTHVIFLRTGYVVETTTSQPAERRRVRSTNASRAMNYLFEAITDTTEISDLALADSRGLLLVHSGSEPACDVLAAYAPLLTKTLDSDARHQLLGTMASYVNDASPDRITVRRFAHHGEELYVCALGGETVSKDVAVCRAIRGARRILA